MLVTVNDYEVGLFNGDIGLLWRDPDQRLRAYFPLAEGQVRRIAARQLPPHERAYALTVHKSQGSEFEEVLLVLPFERAAVVTRELLYTGITRARRAITVHGEGTGLAEACQIRVQRTSALAERLGWPAERRGTD